MKKRANDLQQGRGRPRNGNRVGPRPFSVTQAMTLSARISRLRDWVEKTFPWQTRYDADWVEAMRFLYWTEQKLVQRYSTVKEHIPSYLQTSMSWSPSGNTPSGPLQGRTAAIPLPTKSPGR